MSDYSVVSRTTDLVFPFESHRISDYTAHPLWDESSIVHDIAVFEINTADRFDFDFPLKGITLPSSWDAIVTGLYIRAAGWGATRKNTSNPYPVLAQIKIKVVEDSECPESQRNPDWTFCAETCDDSGFCQGDSGGHLVAYGSLVGIISRAKGCFKQENPVAHLDIIPYVEWIKKMMNQ